MMVRYFGYNDVDIYRFYNIGHSEYPNLPPPPNPTGLQTFMLACLEITLEQMKTENGQDEPQQQQQRRPSRPPRRR